MGSHQSARMVTDNWLTPPHILAALGPFDLDPCAPPEWPSLEWPHAQRWMSPPEDGLAEEWKGRVWLNPPYSREAVKWLCRLAAHGEGTALVFARTETEWFVSHIWGQASALLFLDGRVYFHRSDGSKADANAGAPSVLAAYGTEDAVRLSRCGLPGAFVSGWRCR
jgi:DNA N-6-adenine-methyltransferase (Dam)